MNTSLNVAGTGFSLHVCKGSDNGTSKVQENLLSSPPTCPAAHPGCRLFLTLLWKDLDANSLSGEGFSVFKSQSFLTDWLSFLFRECIITCLPKIHTKPGQVTPPGSQPAIPSKWAAANKLGRKQTAFLPHYGGRVSLKLCRFQPWPSAERTCQREQENPFASILSLKSYRHLLKEPTTGIWNRVCIIISPRIMQWTFYFCPCPCRSTLNSEARGGLIKAHQNMSLLCNGYYFRDKAKVL